jgi:hypothetical protein
MIIVIKLHQIELSKAETCLTYALRRIGLEPSKSYCYESLENDFNMIPFREFGQLTQGVLLLWDSNREYVELPWSIDEKGRIVTSKISSRIHLAVYEGNGLVSDCSRRGNPSSLPSLKMRKLREIDREPDKVLVYKHQSRTATLN